MNIHDHNNKIVFKSEIFKKYMPFLNDVNCYFLIICLLWFFLHFWASPIKPVINGNLTSLVGTNLELTCISKSFFAPNYYSRRLAFSYTWFVNNTNEDDESRSTLRLNVTRGHKDTHVQRQRSGVSSEWCSTD